MSYPIPRASAYLVIHVGNVHDKVDIELEVVAHNAPNDIGADIVSGVTQMRVVVYRRAARVPSDFLAGRVDGNKGRL